MIFGPVATFVTSGHPALDHLEKTIPGVEVRGVVGRRHMRLKAFTPPSARFSVQTWEITVALHSAWRLAEEAALCGMQGTWRYSPDCEQVFSTIYTTAHRAWLDEYGRALLEAAVAAGEITQHFVDIAAPYQVQAGAWGATRPWSLLSWRVGSGKTGGALATMAARPERRILVLCPAGARKEWRTGGDRSRRKPSSVERFSGFETFRLLPESERAKDEEPFADYRLRMQREGRKEILVVGMESMDSHQDTISAFSPDAIYFDEIHRLGDSSRWKMKAGQDGKDSFHLAETETGGSTRAVVAMQISQIPTVAFRCGLSGTPLDDGRQRRLWAPLDLLSPASFGPYSAYRERYCAYRIAETGYGDDSGSSHTEELRARCAMFMFDVPRSESHRAMKTQIRFEVDYFKRSELCEPDAMRREIKALMKVARSSQQARAQLREACLAETASMKRVIVRDRAKDFLASGQKVMIYLTRHAMADAWGEALRKLGYPGWVAHGGYGAGACDRMVDEYSVHEGGCWLVGTWDAIGESKNGMQCTNLGIVGQLPDKPGKWQQGIGRWDRIDGVGTLVWVPVAEGTQDDREVARLTRKFGTIERFLESPELRELVDKLDGTEDMDALTDELLVALGI